MAAGWHAAFAEQFASDELQLQPIIVLRSSSQLGRRHLDRLRSLPDR
jgi:hypothetical protein